MKLTRALVAILAALLLTLTACASTGGTATEGSGPAAETKATDDKPEGDEAGSKTAKIGDAYKFEDGLTVEIIRTTRTKASQAAAGADPGDPVAVLDLRITNKTGGTFDAALVDVKLSYGADGVEAERVFDSEGLDGMSGKIAQGKSKTAKYAFGVPAKQMGDVTVEVTPSFDHETAIFEGKIAK